ncbi:hypothetical protein [Grimontia kaedaensis]|uniref:hypothetical protein n=1 Tax=Grimontia kaedaensis TaxID=2872157 RepID=UPI0020741873|nr:hypothetical protein [Grimontia kaedaensis]
MGWLTGEHGSGKHGSGEHGTGGHSGHGSHGETACGCGTDPMPAADEFMWV